MLPIAEKQIIVQNILLTYYFVQGLPGGKTLIFLHGWGSESKIWFETIKPLIHAYTLLFIDLPGFGKSEQPNRVIGVVEYAEIIHQCLEKLHVKSYCIVGHSFGGSIGIEYAVSYPKSVQALILVNSAGIRPKTPRKTFIHTLSRMVHPLFRIRFMQPLRRILYEQIGATDYLDASPFMRQIYQRILTEDLTDRMFLVIAPVLIIWGENDTETPLTDGELMHETILESTLIVLPAAGHFSFLDKPDEFSMSVKSFIDSV